MQISPASPAAARRSVSTSTSTAPSGPTRTPSSSARTVVESIREGAYENVKSNENIGFVEGHDVFESAHEIRVGDRTLSAETAVINAGARPAKPAIDGLDDIDVHDSTDLLERESVPESLAVIGGGYVGCEYARMYGPFGADSPSSSAGSVCSRTRTRR